jgi:glycosyltransferase involved in cell wall biosynthesis
MKLGFICPPINNAYYRAIIPMRALESRGHTVVWPVKLGEDAPTRELVTCDLVHCYRRGDRPEDLKQLSKRGVALSFDNDDDFALAEVSDGGSGLAGSLYNRKVARRLLQAAKLCDLVTTPSEALADSYRRAGIGDAVVIQNYLDRGTFSFGSPSRHPGIVVGWIAGREHRLDLERVPILDPLRRLLETHADLRVLTVGVRLPLRSDRYEYIERVEYPDLLKVIARIDVGLAPLADTAFNRSRSNVKLKEYGAGGATWLASPVGPYRELGESQGGSLVADDDWFAAIDALLRSRRTRSRLAKRALRWARGETIDAHVEQWAKAFLATIDRVRERH